MRRRGLWCRRPELVCGFLGPLVYPSLPCGCKMSPGRVEDMICFSISSPLHTSRLTRKLSAYSKAHIGHVP